MTDSDMEEHIRNLEAHIRNLENRQAELESQINAVERTKNSQLTKAYPTDIERKVLDIIARAIMGTMQYRSEAKSHE